MSQIIRSSKNADVIPSPIIKKIIDGEIVEYVDFEMLSQTNKFNY